MHEITFTHASAQDIEDIMALQALCHSPDLQENESVFISILEKSSFCFGMLDEDRYIGYCLAHMWHDLREPPCLNVFISSTHEPTCVFVHDMCVHPDYQGNSLGTRFFLYIASKLPSHFPIALIAINSTARSFWKRLGFLDVSHPSACAGYPPGSTYMIKC
jgi:GNAT superfamily N-acetyltransferase